MKKKLIYLLKLLKTLQGISWSSHYYYIISHKDLIQMLFIGLPISIIIRIISPFILIRIMHINVGRIGEFIINPAIYLYQKEYKINSTRQKSLDIFYLEEKAINSFLLRMIKRKINIRL